MANYDLRDALGKNYEASSRAFQWKKTLDFSEHNLAAADTADFITIPKGTVVQGVDVVLKTPQGAVATIDIGDAAFANGFMDNGDMNGAADELVAFAGTEQYADGKYYAADTVLSLLANNTLDTAVIELIVWGYQIG